MTSMTNVIHANMLNKNVFAHKVCNEYVVTKSIVMYFPKDFYLIDAINKKLSQFISSGIIKLLIDKYIDMRYWKVKKTQSGPRPLKFQHLRGGFTLWGFLCFLSSIVLLLEICNNFLQNFRFGLANRLLVVILS